jgi:hypothetical protein
VGVELEFELVEVVECAEGWRRGLRLRFWLQTA